MSYDYQCPICERWFSEGCEHFSQETGAIKLEFRKAAMEAIENNKSSWADMYESFPEAEEYDAFVKAWDEQEEADRSF